MIGIAIMRKARLHGLLCEDRDDDGSESHSARFSFDEGATFVVRLTPTEYRALKTIPASQRRRLVVDLSVSVARPVEEASAP